MSKRKLPAADSDTSKKKSKSQAEESDDTKKTRRKSQPIKLNDGDDDESPDTADLDALAAGAMAEIAADDLDGELDDEDSESPAAAAAAPRKSSAPAAKEHKLPRGGRRAGAKKWSALEKQCMY